MTITAHHHFDITFSDAAIQHIKKMLDKNNAFAFRLSIKKTGCSGFAYAPAMVTEAISDEDIVLNIAEMTIVIDTRWQHLLEGLHVDYLDQDHTQLKQKRLIFTNPKEKARCGCGESFHVE